MLSTLLPLLTAAIAFQPVIEKQQVSPDTGQVQLLLGTLSAPLSGDLALAAKDWALNNRALLGLPAGATVRVADAFSTHFGASFHLQLVVDGLDVHGQKIVITVNRASQVMLVSSSVQPWKRAELAFQITPSVALKAAATAVPFSLNQKNGLPYGGVRHTLLLVGDSLRAGYVAMVPSLDHASNWFALIDGTTGTVISTQNRVYHAADSANVYASSPGGLDAGVGVTPTITAQLTHADGGSMVLPNDGGYLNGTQLTAYNCCVNKDCSLAADAGPKRASGTANVFGINVAYDTVECDRKQRASNDPLINDGGSYEYPPQDPPALVGGQPGPVRQSDPAHSDEFSEVHAFFHVNQMYDWVRGLSSTAAPIFPGNQPAIVPFKMRDEKLAQPKKPAVWTNVMFPDFAEVQANIQCVINPPCRLNNLGRVDNAAYLPKEAFPQLILPDYMLDVDTLLIFQGNRADFGYDAPVLWHELGHGVIYATANLSFDALAIDSRSANNETGAMHEGFADFLAGAFGNNPNVGTYVGPRIGSSGAVMGVRTDSYLRSMDNTFACPDVLWGEVHQDSQHVSAALWKARSTVFAGTNGGKTFDAAFYASLVSMSPTVDFAAAAAIISAHLAIAFPAIVDAATKMNAIFDEKGVTNCSKLLEVTNASPARPMYAISSASGLGGSVIPGPYQFKLKVPNGAQTVTLTATQSNNNPLAQPVKPKVLVKKGQPITFTKMGSSLTNNADVTGDFTGNGALTATITVDAPCGATSEVYVTLGATGASTITNLKVTATPPSSCTPNDSGTDAGADAGTDGGVKPDAGSDAGAGDSGVVFVDGGVTTIPSGGTVTGDAAPAGCGCGAGGMGFGALAMLALLGFRRRSRA